MRSDHSWIFPVLHQLNCFCVRVGEQEAAQHILKAWDSIPKAAHVDYSQHTRFHWVTICKFADVELTLRDISEYLSLNNLLAAEAEVRAARAKILAVKRSLSREADNHSPYDPQAN